MRIQVAASARVCAVPHARTWLNEGNCYAFDEPTQGRRRLADRLSPWRPTRGELTSSMLLLGVPLRSSCGRGCLVISLR
jgi:hypothetical protein